MVKKRLPEPTPDIYRILDSAGLTYADLTSTRQPMRKLVEMVRNEIAQQFKVYLEAREYALSKEKKHGKV